MTAQQRTVSVSEIPELVEDAGISIVGDHGGLSLITGEVEESSLVPGTLSIETEHGVLYLPEDHQQTICEE